jgi:probable F420-dependent oxidoreductase
MELGLALPQFDFSVAGESPLQWSTVARWAQRAESLGFGSLWVADHLALGIEKYGGSGEYAGFDALATLAALARMTDRVKLGTLVLCIPLHPPAVTAKALATIDVLSDGRVIAGLGAGWYRPEFDRARLPFEPLGVRLERLVEAIEIVRGLFGGGPFSFAGQHYRVENARCLPVPIQRPHPPIWVGGRGDRSLDVAARHADGWNVVWRFSPDEYRVRVAVLERACERAGRDPADVTRSLGLYTLVGEDERDVARRFERLRSMSPKGVLDGVSLADWRQGHLVGTVEQVQDQLQQWQELGVSTFIVGLGALSFAVTTDDDLEMIATAGRLESR